MFDLWPSLYQHEFPLLLNWTDNTTAKSWIRKAATRTQKGKALQRILCGLMINNPIGIEAKHIAGIKKNLADAISRVYTSSYSKLSFTKVFQEFPQMRSWNRFLPSQDLLSYLCSSLSVGQRSLCPPKLFRHFVQGKNTL